MVLKKHLDTPIGASLSTMGLESLMATLKRPELLLLDEHTAALTQKTSVAFDGINIICQQASSDSLDDYHHMEDALKYGNRLIAREGRIIQDLIQLGAKMKISDYYQLFE